MCTSLGGQWDVICNGCSSVTCAWWTCGKLCCHNSVRIIYACHPENNIWGNLPAILEACQVQFVWGMIVVFGHTQIVRMHESGGVYIVVYLLVCCMVILFAWKKKLILFTENFWGVQNGQSLHGVVLLFWRLNINLDCNNYSILDILYVVEIKYWAWLNLCLYRRRTFHTSGWWCDKVTTLLMRASAL